MKTPLFAEHEKLAARMIDFSGWTMPLQYSSIIGEHLHTRSKAGLFDTCHMGEFLVQGEQAQTELNKLVTNNLDNLPPGKCGYGFMLNSKGGVLDDLITYKFSEQKFMLVVNAGEIEKDRKWLTEHLSPEIQFEDISAKTDKLDLQGAVSERILSEALDSPLDSLTYFSFTSGKWQGKNILISKTGYTGELGYEVYPKESNDIILLWRELLKYEEVKPCGLGARDTLRLEMGYLLYGQDLDEQHTPLNAQLGKFVDTEKDFTGREALLVQKAEGIGEKLVGFELEGRRAARPGFLIFEGEEEMGKVTSGSFSPSLGKAIGLGYVKSELSQEGKKINIRHGTIQLHAKIVKLPFYPPSQKATGSARG